MRSAAAIGDPSDFGSVHHEVELAVLIKRRCVRLRRACPQSHCRLRRGADLTLRDVQGKMKAGQLWKRPAFDNSCPLSGIYSAAELPATCKIQRWA
ncbi:MAG: fumarylacetoacetate hydrolase family protein [Escherichia sp.]